ncbi:hypothetical protein JCM24511_07295 [Saitozyma sp. JCM 24511]|nr:hypothetical protein JCM24511_07295 [Saitozyma sp. JCM 24511]
MQQTRAVLVVGEAKNKVWDAVKEAKMRNETEKIDRVFKSGYGTVLFFSDLSIVFNWSNQMPTYAEAFKVFDAQASGMLHYNVWTALELEGHGPICSTSAKVLRVSKTLGLPDSWHNTALLNFGLPAGSPRDKEYAPIDERVMFFDA